MIAEREIDGVILGKEIVEGIEMCIDDILVPALIQGREGGDEKVEVGQRVLPLAKLKVKLHHHLQIDFGTDFNGLRDFETLHTSFRKMQTF